MKIIYMSLAATFLSGCASSYKQPEDPKTSAMLTTTHITESFPSSTIVTVFNKEDCADDHYLGRFATIGRATDLYTTKSSGRIAAGERIYLSIDGWTQNHKFIVGGTRYTDFTCVNLISFIPAVGKGYSLSQRVLEGNRCITDLIEDESGQSPSSLQRHAVSKSCRAKLK